MGFRFRRQLRILPGLYLNVSKSVVTTSVGGHGSTLNISKRGTRTTIGLTGSGLSWQSRTEPWPDGIPRHAPANDVGNDLRTGRWIRGLVLAALIVAVVVILALMAG
jgi:hypothetical protein